MIQPNHMCLLLVSLVTQASYAQTYTGVFSDATGDPGSVSIAPGDSFTFSFNLLMSDGANANALDYHLRVDGNAGAGGGKFFLTGRDRTGSKFVDTTYADVTGTLNPSTTTYLTDAASLGASTDPFANLIGDQFVATYTLLTSADLAPGVYTIAIDQGVDPALRSATDADFTARAISASYTVNVGVVPEPASVALLAAGLVPLLARRCRSVARPK